MKSRIFFVRTQSTNTRNLCLWLFFISVFLFVSCIKEPVKNSTPDPIKPPIQDTIPPPIPDTLPPLLGDVTEQVVELGNPFKARYADDTQRVYARNVWDMHAYHGKIYFGGGNSSNYAPASNAGPADLWTFDPASQEFAVEYTVNEEQIHLIREFDDELYLPGHDSRESWALGNFYRLESDGWKKYRKIPNGIHVYDIYKYGGKLYAAIGTGSPNTTNIQVSSDNGQTWSNASSGAYYWRVYTLVPVAGTLHSGDGWLYYSRETSEFSLFSDFPPFRTGLDLGGSLRMERAVVFDEQTVYIIGAEYNDHQYKPFALARARDHSDISRLPLPEEALPRDILLKEEWLVVLASIPTGDEAYKNVVLATQNIDTDPVEWTTLFYFTAPTFARSFEYLNGNFYFGLGCDAEELTSTTWLSPATGDILSVEYEDL